MNPQCPDPLCVDGTIVATEWTHYPCLNPVHATPAAEPECPDCGMNAGRPRTGSHMCENPIHLQWCRDCKQILGAYEIKHGHSCPADGPLSKPEPTAESADKLLKERVAGIVSAGAVMPMKATADIMRLLKAAHREGEEQFAEKLKAKIDQRITTEGDDGCYQTVLSDLVALKGDTPDGKDL